MKYHHKNNIKTTQNQLVCFNFLRHVFMIDRCPMEHGSKWTRLNIVSWKHRPKLPSSHPVVKTIHVVTQYKKYLNLTRYFSPSQMFRTQIKTMTTKTHQSDNSPKQNFIFDSLFNQRHNQLAKKIDSVRQSTEGIHHPHDNPTRSYTCNNDNRDDGEEHRRFWT